MDPLQEQLDRIEADSREAKIDSRETRGIVNKLWARVDGLERKSSFWGVLGGFLAIFATKLAGCV